MILLTASLLLVLQQAPAATPPPSPCAGEEFGSFDFWVGEWDVYQTGGDTQVAESRIEKVSNGCAVRETWMPFRGAGGTSLTALDPATGRWNQLWIGSQPGPIEFEGGPVGETMVLTGYWGQNAEGLPQLIRMSYSQDEDGSVRQFGQASSDHGLTWSDSFDFTYRPKAG